MQQRKFKVGADPEMFLSQDGVFKSAFGLVKGTKEDPFPVMKGAVQVDGMALEFNIDPANDEEEFIVNISTVLAEMSKLVPSYKVMAVPVAHFGHEYIRSQPREAVELGCNPDYNAYTAESNPPPNVDLPFRTGAGHVHIGWGSDFDVYCPDHFTSCCAATKQLDVFLGIPSVLFDKEKQRREMYGRAGAFRPKPYGFEYRVLSNLWVGNEGMQRWVYKATQNAMKALEQGDHLYMQIDHEEVQRIINESDEQAARDVCEAFGLLLPEGV